jgi:membrane associated rhomboid family serine protease
MEASCFLSEKLIPEAQVISYDVMQMTDKPAPEQSISNEEDHFALVIPWADHIPGILLISPMIVAFCLMFFKKNGMLEWAVSRVGLASGKLENLQLHMFAHGSILHITMNALALYSISAAVVNRLGSGMRAWCKFFLLFELSGLGGELVFLTIHRWDDTPMFGASGAVYGLIGFLIRTPNRGEGILPIWSSDMRTIVIDLIKEHFWLFLAFGLPPLLLGRSGGLAWEAHLGGFLTGLIICPYLSRDLGKVE